MIFKTFNNDIDKISSKWGVFGRSFNDIGTAIIGRITDINKAFQATDDLVGSIKDSDSIWKRLYPSKESIKDQLIDVDGLIPEIDKNNFDFDKWINELNDIDKQVKVGTKSWQDYSNSLDDNQKWIAKWGQETEGQIRTEKDLVQANQKAREAALAHNAALKQQTLGAKAAAIGMKALAMAGNMLAMWAITKGIELVVKGIDNLVHSAEHCKERVDELMSSYQSALDKANSNAKTVEDLASRYEELSKGVNNLGENVSLATDEYSEYNDIVNQIADMFPTLVQGYTDEGNAILSLKGNVEQLRDAYKEAQQEAYNMLIVSGKDSDGNDILKDANNVITGSTFGVHDWGNVEKIDYLDKLMNASDSVDSMLDLWNKSNGTYSEWFEDFTGVGGTVNIGKLTDEDLANIRKNAKILKQQYQAEINSAVDNVEILANAYLMTNEDYAKLDEQSKNAASIMVNRLNANIVSKFGEEKENVGKYVDDIVEMISSNPEAKDAMIGLFTMDTTDMPINDIEYWTNEYINTIAKILKDAKILKEDPAELKIRLGFDGSDTQPLINKVQGFLKDEFDDKVGTLTLDELEYASKLEISEGTLLSWDELIAKIKELKELNNPNKSDTFSLTEEQSKAIDDFQSKVNTLQDALSRLRSGSMSNADLIDLKQEFPSLDVEADDLDKQICQLINNSLNTLYAKLDNPPEALKTLLKEIADEAINTSHGITSLSDAMSKLKTNASLLKQASEEMSSGFTMDTLGSMISTYGSQMEPIVARYEMGYATAEEVFAQLEQCYNQDAENYQKSIWANLDTDEEFFSSIRENYPEVFEFLKSLYGSDVDEWLTVAKAKEAIDATLMKNLKKNWSQYYSAVLGDDGKYQLVTTNYDDSDVALVNPETARKTEEELNKYRSTAQNYVDEANRAREALEKIAYTPANFDWNTVSSRSSPSDSDSKDLWKEEFQTKLALLDHYHEMGYIKDKQYYEALNALNEEYFAGQEKYLDDYRSYAEKIYSGLKQAYKDMLDEQKGYMDQTANAVTDYLDEQIDGLNDQIEVIEDEYNARIDAIESEKEALEAQKESVQSQIDSLNDQIEAIEKANEARQKAIDLQKKQYEFNRLMNQKTQQVYQNGQFVHTTDDSAISDARQEVDEAKTDIQIDDLNNQIDNLNSVIDGIDTQIDALDAQIDTLENEMNHLTDSIRSQINDLQNYRDRWAEIPEQFTHVQNQLMAQMMLGQNWQQQALAMDETMLMNFGTSYNNVQGQIQLVTNASAEEIVKMAGLTAESLGTMAASADESLTDMGGSVSECSYISSDALAYLTVRMAVLKIYFKQTGRDKRPL